MLSDTQPRSYWMPFTISTSTPGTCASTQAMPDVSPTASTASAMVSPTCSSRDEMNAMLRTWSRSVICTASSLMAATAAFTPLSMPRRIAKASAPAATSRKPSLTNTSAKSVAVVVPSPASSLVFSAASMTILAPMFSTWFESSICLATVTPSLVIAGAPHVLSRAT